MRPPPIPATETRQGRTATAGRGTCAPSRIVVYFHRLHRRMRACFLRLGALLFYVAFEPSNLIVTAFPASTAFLAASRTILIARSSTTSGWGTRFPSTASRFMYHSFPMRRAGIVPSRHCFLMLVGCCPVTRERSSGGITGGSSRGATRSLLSLLHLRVDAFQDKQQHP